MQSVVRKRIGVGLTWITIIPLPLFYFHLREKVNYTRTDVSLMWCRPRNNNQLQKQVFTIWVNCSMWVQCKWNLVALSLESSYICSGRYISSRVQIRTFKEVNYSDNRSPYRGFTITTLFSQEHLPIAPISASDVKILPVDWVKAQDELALERLRGHRGRFPEREVESVIGTVYTPTVF